jgi:two-component system catabolic regulation response regulator CreB
MPHVLIVEDEMSISDTLIFALQNDGFTTQWVRLGHEAIDQVEQGGVDFVILDVGLPDLSGFETCKAIRRESEVPILFLTARSEEIDRVVGLEIGADDYVVKPFSPREVVARVRTILKRSKRGIDETKSFNDQGEGMEAAQCELKHASEFRIDEARFFIEFRGQALKLTPHEFRLLAHLLREPERVFSRAQLLDAIGGGIEAGYERKIDGHIKTLRAKLNQIQQASDPILTHRGFGYTYQTGRETNST